MAIKFNIEPYWDDFEQATRVDGLTPREKYNRILFRPGHAVQARELTQIQSMLQNQVAGVSDHIFKDGAMVVPGHISIYNKIDYIKLSSTNVTPLTDLIDQTFQNAAGTITCKVVFVEEATESDPITVFVNYTSGSNKFTAGDVLTSGASTMTVSTDADPTGYGALISIDDGIYYIKKNYVIIKKDTITLSKYTDQVTCDVGLKVIETIVGPGEDDTLNDNAQGTPNESAPGAHRYQIKTELVKQDINSSTGNFVLLARLENGTISKQVRSTDYSIIEDTLARRTFDESGNYTVNPFPAIVGDHATDETKLNLAIGPSKAYVRGYEIETLGTTNTPFNKAQDAALFQDSFTQITHDNYIDISSPIGTPDITNYSTINLVDNGSNILGTCRVRSIQKLVSGDYRLHVFDHPATIPAATTLLDGVDFSGTYEGSNLGADTVLYSLPFSRIKSCNGETDPNNPADYNYRYEANRDLGTQPVSGGTNSVTFNTASSAEGFDGYDAYNWILINADTNAIVPITSGDVAVSGNSVTISNLDAVTTPNVNLIAPVSRTSSHKTKTLQSNTQVISGFTSSAFLEHCDGYKVVSVVENAVNVTKYFDFDSGMTDTHYGQASLSLKPGSPFVVTADLTVVYQYFDHVGSGDFFTVDSYPVGTGTNQIAYENIPDYNGVELRSSVDFRPRMDDATGSNFTGTGSSVSVCPRPNTTFQTDIQYYLNRIDKVFLDKDGEFGVIEGVSSLEPAEPSSPKDSLVLYHLYIPAYTLSASEVEIQNIDNRRYTMRDIGNLENRINTLEYYTSLSLLEKEAENKQILDDVTAIPRFKSGFLVDSFTSTTVGRVTSPEFKTGIDVNNSTLRPLFNENNTSLLFDDTASTAERHGDLITLPIASNSELITQTQSSGSMNVNPFNVFNWGGSLTLSPSSDEWKDIDRRPQLIINQDGVYNALRDIIDSSVATGTVWNSWQTNWTGTTSSSSTSGRRVETSTTTTSGQSRVGTLTTIVDEVVRTNIGDRTVGINFAPYVRSRIIEFVGTGMRPNTSVYAFIDGINIADYVSTNDASAIVPAIGVNTIIEHPAGATTLTTDGNGSIVGTIWVPNNELLSFTSGDRTITLSDSITNDKDEVSTFAATTYSARGLIETKENVIISTRTPRVQRRTVSDTRITTSTRTNVRWIDPLAQSFMVEMSGGAFVTSIDLFFTAKDDSIPVQLQVREMNQGLPTQKIVPFADVTVNSADVNTDGTATSFTFSSPVYLQDTIEYCFVILANSNSYRVKYAAIGDKDENDNTISKQPYNGVLFKSQNASTWTADQNKDLTFVMHRAVFDTATSADVILKNDTVPMRYLTVDPFATTNASNEVIVTHNNHGLTDGDLAYFKGAEETNGIPAAELNSASGLVVSASERDKYTVTVTTNATSTGVDGGETVTAAENQMWNTIYPYIQEITLPNTSMGWSIKDTNQDGNGTYTLNTLYNPLIINSNYTADTPKSILSTINGTAQSIDESLFIRGTFDSSMDNISPVIDMERCSVYTISNRINNPAGSVSAGFNVVADFAEETDPSAGSALSKYITKIVKLDESSNQLKVFLDVNRPSYTGIRVFYKTSTLVDGFDNLNWTEMAASVPYSDDIAEYKEVEFSADPADFTAFAIKIVFTSQNTSKIPTAKKLRAIALAV